MGKKQKQQKRLINELEHALAQTLSDWAIERQANRSLREVIGNDRQRHTMVVNALTNGMRRITEERDAALADVETLTDANAEADATIGELRALVEQQRKDWSGDVSAAREIVERKSNEIVDLRRTISELRGDLSDTHERLDAALTEAARMRKEWANDASVAREIIARKTEEYIKLRRDSADTISELRGDLAEVRGELERVTEPWQHAEDLLQERERELDAQQEHANQRGTLCFGLGIAQASHIDAVIAAARAQAAASEPVVTLKAIKELEEGERLIDDDGVIIECKHVGYGVYPKIGTPYFLPGPQATLNLYEQLKAKTMQ